MKTRISKKFVALLIVLGGAALAAGEFVIPAATEVHNANQLFRAPVDIQESLSAYSLSVLGTITYSGAQANFIDAGVVRTGFIDAGCGIVGGLSMNSGNFNASGNGQIDGTLNVGSTLSTASGNIISGGDMQVGTTASTGADLKIGRSLYMSPAGVYSLADEDEAPTITAASGCTTPTVTYHNGSANFQVDVGSSCSGVSTIGITFGRAATNKWQCQCTNISATATRTIDQSDGSSTAIVLTNYSRTLGTAADFADGADIRCMCRGG